MIDDHGKKASRHRGAKAVAAGAIGVALLAGLGTTFAKWYDEQQIGQASLQAGHLRFEVTGEKWVDVNNGGVTIDPATFRMVPGDTLRYTASVTPDLVGDNLKATLRVNTSETVTGSLKDIVTVTTIVGTGTDTERTVTPQDTTAIPVTVEITFPFTANGAEPVSDKSNWWHTGGEDGAVNLAATKVELVQIKTP